MNYKVYIQSLNNFPIEDWAVSAYLGFRAKQIDIIFFEDIEEVPISKYNIVVGFIEDTNKYLEKLGIGYKKALNIPKELQSYTGRFTTIMPMGKLKSLDDSYYPLFVKSNDKAKEFIAGIATKKQTILDTYYDIKDDKQVFVSEVVDFISEYRGYVYDKTLKGLYWYKGDFKVFPDVNIIEQAIGDYNSQPAGYSIDFGVTSDNKTLLIECNDGWSLGNYGLDHTLYANLLLKRWLQLTNK